jgi:hypothetical protein
LIQIQSQAIQQEIARMQQAEPGLSFLAAWRRLRQEKPWMFGPEFGTRSMSASNDKQGPQGTPQLRKAQAVIHAAAQVLQREEGLSFQEAWERLKKKHPELFERLARAGDRGPVKVVQATGDWSYIMLRAEDADELRQQVAAGWWD